MRHLGLNFGGRYSWRPHRIVVGTAFLPSVLFAVIFLLGMSSTSHAQDTTFSRRDMLANIGQNIIMPVNQALVVQIDRLDQAVVAVSALRDIPSLSVAQSQWRATMATWRPASVFALGRQTLVLHAAIESDVPPNIEYLETLLADPTITLDDAFLLAQGSNMAGLGALEYLLFGTAGTPDAHLAVLLGETGVRRLEYARAISSRLKAAVTDLFNYWSPEGENYLATFIDDDDPNGVRESISMLVNAMIAEIEEVTNMDFAMPMGLGVDQNGQPAPEFLRSPYSNDTLLFAQSTMEMMRSIFTSGDGTTLGLGDYLDALGIRLGDVPLSQVIVSEIDLVIADIVAIDMPLRRALTEKPEAVQKVYDDLRTLYLMMKTNMVSQMGLTITFTDSDGD